MKTIYVMLPIMVILIIGFGQAHAAEKFVTNQTITWQVMEWTDDQNVTNEDLANILDESIFEWETFNPGLKFEQTESNSDVRINWGNIRGLGVASCENECLTSNVIDYSIYVSIGAENCLGEFTYMTHDFIKRVTMHELGHTLGITHSHDNTNLMFGQTIYGNAILRPVGFNDYNIPHTSSDWWEGEEQLWDDMMLLHEQFIPIEENMTVYEGRIAMMEKTESNFQTAFEENAHATKIVLIEMTVADDVQMKTLEAEMAELQANLEELNQRYERHAELYEKWIGEFETIHAELILLEKRTNETVDALACYPAMSKESVMRGIAARLI